MAKNERALSLHPLKFKEALSDLLKVKREPRAVLEKTTRTKVRKKPPGSLTLWCYLLQTDKTVLGFSRVSVQEHVGTSFLLSADTSLL